MQIFFYKNIKLYASTYFFLFQKFLNPLVSTSLTSTIRKSSTASEATFDTREYKLHKLNESPSASASVTRDEALKYYRQMQMIRRLESASGNLYKEKV